jgi:hypothetical protein
MQPLSCPVCESYPTDGVYNACRCGYGTGTEIMCAL